MAEVRKKRHYHQREYPFCALSKTAGRLDTDLGGGAWDVPPLIFPSHPFFDLGLLVTSAMMGGGPVVALRVGEEGASLVCETTPREGVKPVRAAKNGRRRRGVFSDSLLGALSAVNP